jgi:meso-butanediol dehydrogenase/(S,S)-butanediol dehydrogenase/diacetyl reductase
MSTYTSLDGKAALITGGASGIGYATAELFRRSGADVVIADINEEGLRAAAHRLGEYTGGKLIALLCDSSDSGACTRLIEDSVKGLGKLDILCNIAGILATGHTADFTDERWQRVLAVNLNGPFYLSKRAIPHLLETRGCIINIASTAGLVGVPYGAAYSASKAGVIGLTRAMASEYAQSGVRVNAICPGHVATPMTANAGGFAPDTDLQLLMHLAPLTGKASQPSEIAEAIVFLSSAVNATGTILTIDGGQTTI